MTDYSIVKAIVRGNYQIQKLRIQTGLRVVATVKKKLGQEPGEKETELTPEAKALLKELRYSYRRLTDGVIDHREFSGEGLISNYSEYALVAQYMELEAHETQQFRMLEHILGDFPIYTEYLRGVRGVGPALAGVLLSEIDITKCKYVSSIWKYAGLDVAEDGQGRSRKAEHLIEVEYADKHGDVKTRKSITFNPFLKTKLIGVMGTSFLRTKDCPYKEVYNAYKTRLEHHVNHKEKSKGHRHNMAVRYMVKIFLKDLYAEWRRIEGLEVHPPYEEAKLGYKHGNGRSSEMIH